MQATVRLVRATARLVQAIARLAPFTVPLAPAIVQLAPVIVRLVQVSALLGDAVNQVMYMITTLLKCVQHTLAVSSELCCRSVTLMLNHGL